MDSEAFTPGTDEVELEHKSGIACSIRGERGKMGTVVLTNDRVLFTHQKYAAGPGGGALPALIAGGLQKRHEKKSGGPTEVFELAEVKSARLNHRRMLPDLYEFTLADGDTCWFSHSLRKRWEATIRRLLTERHGRTVVDEGDEAWHVE